jgi:hypothetical protein
LDFAFPNYWDIVNQIRAPEDQYAMPSSTAGTDKDSHAPSCHANSALASRFSKNRGPPEADVRSGSFLNSAFFLFHSNLKNQQSALINPSTDRALHPAGQAFSSRHASFPDRLDHLAW